MKNIKGSETTETPSAIARRPPKSLLREIGVGVRGWRRNRFHLLGGNMQIIKIDYKSIFKKGLKPIKEDYEDCLICGRMGSGKTYYAIYKTEKELKRKKKVYTNIRTYTSSVHEVIKIDDWGQIPIMGKDDFDSVWILDECSKRFPKDSKVDKDFYEFLQHSRKQNRSVYMIFQEYIMVPQWLRGVCDRVYTTSKIGFLCKTDLGIPYLDKDSYEWNLDNIGFTIYKRNKEIAKLYDTREIIN